MVETFGYNHALQGADGPPRSSETGRHLAKLNTLQIKPELVLGVDQS